MTSNFPMSYPTSQPAKSRAGPVFAGQVMFKNVAYMTRGKSILRDINLTVEAGQIACLLGPSGCGKTTLLRLAAGLIAPTAGQILLDQFEIAGPQRFVPPEQRNIGLVFQDFALFPHMTAQENVAYGLYALERREALRVATLALERVGLGHVTAHYPTTLSGGEQQRVALARALAPRPQVLLLDEPFSGLDQRLKEAVRDDTLALLRETRATALLVTHDPDEALALADKIHVMQAGEIAQSGTPHALIHHPATRDVARFFSNYNSFTGVVHKNTVQLPVGTVQAKGLADGTAVEVLAAPHGFHIVDELRGAAATIVENRDLGGRRRILARLHATDQLILVHSSVNAICADSGTIGLALTGQDTHIFPISTPAVS
jgi:iron(III) transport system ATP-binding protein